MSDLEGGSVDELGWQLDVDADADEIRFEHVDTGNAYVFDDEGNLRVAGDEEIGGDIEALRRTLAAALDGESSDALSDGTFGTGGCRVECDEGSGEVTIRSDAKISLAAPVIELSASGPLTLDGAIISLN
jgi:hypothetical protein